MTNAPTLAEAMDNVATAKTKRQSLLEQYLEQMNAEDAALLREWLADTVGYSSRAIAEALTLAGYPIKHSAVGQYRRDHRQSTNRAEVSW